MPNTLSLTEMPVPMMLNALAVAARARGIDRLNGIVLRDNDPMLGLIERHAPGAVRIDAGDHFEVDVGLGGRRFAA